MTAIATTPFKERLAAFVSTGADLPTIPTSLFELQRLMRNEHATEGQVVTAVEKDPALVGRLLKAANAAGVAMGGDRVASVQIAIRRLGLRRVHSLSLAVSMVKAFSDKAMAVKPEPFWAHSAAVGAVARSLATTYAPDNIDPDDLYTAGLLHDVGLLMLDQFFEADFQRVMALRTQVNCPWWEHERLLLDVTHGEIGGMLLEKWGLPEQVVNAVVYHHEPERAPERHRFVALLIRAAECVCATEALALDTEGLPTDLGADAIVALGAEDEAAQTMLEGLRTIATLDRGMLL